jgi:hypothetical protein
MVHIGKRWLAGLMAATVAFAVAFGAAASLGLTVDTLSADQVAINACDTAVDSSYTTVYSATAGGYVVDEVTLSGIDADCDGFDFKVTLAGSSNTALGNVDTADAVLTGTDPNMSLVSDFSSQDILAENVILIAVSITE